MYDVQVSSNFWNIWAQKKEKICTSHQHPRFCEETFAFKLPQEEKKIREICDQLFPRNDAWNIVNSWDGSASEYYDTELFFTIEISIIISSNTVAKKKSQSITD